MAALLAPCSPVSGPYTCKSPSSHLLHGCLALKLVASSSFPKKSRSIDFLKPIAATPAPSTTLSRDRIVGPFCPRFSSRPSLGFHHRNPRSARSACSRVQCSSQFATHRTQLSSLKPWTMRPIVSACGSNFNGAPILMDEQGNQNKQIAICFGVAIRPADSGGLLERGWQEPSDQLNC